MTSRFLLGLLCVASAVATSGRIDVRAQTPSAVPFRAGVDMVVLQVTVTGKGGRYVPGLDANDFMILENGRPQRLAFFSKTRTPVALSFVLDTSTSMSSMLPLAQEAAVTLARQLGPDDVAQVIAFSHTISIVQPFTNSLPALEAAIRGTRANGSTALYTAVYVALNEMRLLEASYSGVVRRHAIVLLSDGADTSSVVSFDQLLDRAQRQSVAIYTIGLQVPEPNTSSSFDEARFVLRQLARATGGRIFFAEQPQDLTRVYGQIAQELSNQYTLAYVSTTAGDAARWRAVAVHVTRPDCVAATRPGYFVGQ